MRRCNAFGAIVALLICATSARGFEFEQSLAQEIDRHPNENFHVYRSYQSIVIADPATRSAGLYFRISQRGVDYVASLLANGLPELFHRLVLPTISESGLTLKDAMITRLDRPDIDVHFVRGHGVDIAIRLPELRISGAAELSVLFASYNAQLLAISRNLTFHMRINIHRQLDEEHTKVVVTNCFVNPGGIELQYYGRDAGEFYTIGNIIQDGIDGAIRDKICILPMLASEFIREKIDSVMSPPAPAPTALPDSIEETFGGSSVLSSSTERRELPSVIDHLCDSGLSGPSDGAPDEAAMPNGDDPDVDLIELNGTWVPDLSLRYPPTFSAKDLIFGVDGGIIVDGVPASSTIERPKFENDTIIRDQMIGLIVSEYVPNTLFHQIFARGLGTVTVTYSLRHVPNMLRSLAKLACPDCRLILNANLTTTPRSSIDRNGIVLLLEGDISVNFQRKTKNHNLLEANGQIRVLIKPHFRHSRLFSDVLLAGVDIKVYKAGMSGLMAGAVRKLLSFLVPRAIWPKIQQRLRLAVNYKGIRIPRICTMEFKHLHLDYISHAAVLSGDFDVDLPLLIRSFKMFMDERLRRADTRAELESGFRYL